MQKFRTRNDIEINGVRQGYSFKDSFYLRRHDNAASDPELQVFSDEDDDEEPEERTYFCASCKSRLDYHQYLDIWICGYCFQQYDPKIQDSPIKDKSDFKLTPYADLQHYPQFGSDNMPFVESIDLSNREEGLEQRIHEDKRIQTINLHNVTFADALMAGSLSARKKPDNAQERL